MPTVSVNTMKLNWTKIAVYVTIVGAGLLIAIETRTPPMPKPPVVQSEPVPPAVPPPVVVPPPVAVEPSRPEWKTEPLPPTLEIPKLRPRVVKPKPAVKPEPVAPRRASKSKFEPKSVNPNPECREVPAAAYQHPPDVVLAAAKRMYVTTERMNVLKRCIGG